MKKNLPRLEELITFLHFIKDEVDLKAIDGSVKDQESQTIYFLIEGCKIILERNIYYCAYKVVQTYRIFLEAEINGKHESLRFFFDFIDGNNGLNKVQVKSNYILRCPDYLRRLGYQIKLLFCLYEERSLFCRNLESRNRNDNQ